MPTPSAHLDYAQLEGLWISQGGPPRLAPVMAAIAMAESGGNARAFNPNDNNGLQSSYGLWQISNGTHSPPSPAWANPETNAKLAVEKWKSQGLRAWGTYVSGLYKKYFRRGVTPQMPQGGGGSKIPYSNPFRNVSGLTPERIDQGVDYSGSGDVWALGPGRIVATQRSGWPGGGFIAERLSSGPLAGHYVYVAENIFPTVQVGQQVTDTTKIGVMAGGIETGFAAPPPQLGVSLARATGQWNASQQPTAYGVAYSKLLTELGAPAGIGPTKGGVGSTAPGWPPKWLLGILGGIINFGGGGGGGGGAGGLFGGLIDAVNRIAQSLESFVDIIDWLVQPANWVRIISGVSGGILVIIGLNSFRHISGPSSTNISLGPAGSVTVPEASGNIALALGIGEIGLGGVLLFVAFHNLGTAAPANIGELLGSLRDQSVAASAGAP